VDVSGPSALNTNQPATWNAVVSGGTGQYAYQWFHRPGNAGAWTPVGTNSSYSRTMGTADFQLMLQVTSAGATVADVHCVAWGLTPSVAISGPRSMAPSAVGSFTASATGGSSCGTYTYAWRFRSPPGAGIWSGVVSTSPSYAHMMAGTANVELQCTVTGVAASVDTHLVDAPPLPITNLDVVLSQYTGVLYWTAPGDNGGVDPVVVYDVRYGSQPINEVNFNSMPQIDPNSPQQPGLSECLNLAGLASCSPYHFAIKSRDAAGNWSPISNAASGTTRCRISPNMLCEFMTTARRAPLLDTDAPAQVELGIPAPQPVRRSASLQYGIPAEQAGARLTLSLFDVLGRRVRTLVDGVAEPGRHSVSLATSTDEGRPLAGGVYFLRMSVGTTTLSRSIVVLD
jgi:hypothetical protein